jgi:CelD/BcsL family acetyltransferase involved in cellulose biosynthesis
MERSLLPMEGQLLLDKTHEGQLEFVDPHAACAKAIWCGLERAARPPYFLTWGWVDNWLASLPGSDVPVLAVIRDAGEVVGAFFLSRRKLVRHRVVASRAAFINTTGVPSYDELCIEHNGILGYRCTLAKLIELLPDDWDELYLPGIDRARFRELDVPPGYRVRVDREVPSPFVDLARVRAADDYLSLVSANTRSQIRRARRRVGTCELDVARSLGEALELYDELVALHAASWRARGEPGAFANPWFDRFHRRLIEQRFAHGEIQLLRLRSGSATIGCLYNLVASDRVLFYQSGLARSADPHVKPGMLCHAAAIAHCAGAGHVVYDLLGGSARYKASLATDATRLIWLRVQRARLRFAIEERMRGWKRALVAAFAGAS